MTNFQNALGELNSYLAKLRILSTRTLGNSGRIEKLTASDDDATAGNCQLHGITVSFFVKI